MSTFAFDDPEAERRRAGGPLQESLQT